MESKAKAFGHPIHTMLIVFPLGLFVTAVIFDILYLVRQNELFAVVSFYNILGGVIGGIVAAIFGFRDWAAIPEGTRAKRIGILHGMGNLLVVILFSWSLIMRQTAPGYAPTIMALLPSLLAVAVATVTGWMGGELVNRLGVGVDPGANLNAPSSLSGQPASHAGQGSFVPVTGDETENEKH